jgi:hypothetical protein
LVDATVPGGGTYTGTVTGRAVGSTLEMSWDTTAGRYFGIGLQEGGSWYVACGEDRTGLGLALLGAGGELHWTPAGARGMTGLSTLVSTPSAGGLIWQTGAQGSGGFPFTRLVLTGSGEVAEAELTGGSTARGLALPTAGGWAVAWYPDFEQTVILCYRPGPEPGTWTARWALGGKPGIAWERLRPPR